MTIIDSLFLELGIDTSKFSKDQQAALAKIAQFESQTKRAASGARGGIQTVGDAFRDLAKDSRIGASAASLDNLATKFKNLGISMQVSGGAGTPFGAAALGLGRLLSPATLGAAAVGMLATETWSFNKEMTAVNATLARNAELSGMSATNLWAMGMAAKTIGGDPAAVQASIASLQTALAGMSIGVGNATPQLIGMARLRRYGARFNTGGFGKGVDEESLFKAGYAYYQQHGRAATMAMLTQHGLTNADQADLIMSPTGYQEYKKAQAQAEAIKTGGGFDAIVRESLKSQVGLGEADIAKSVAAESAYGGIQQPMQTIVGLLADIYAVLSSILGYIARAAAFFHIPEIAKDIAGPAVSGMGVGPRLLSKGAGFARKTWSAIKTLMGLGIPPLEAASLVGNQMQESGLDPYAVNASGHRGIGQWDKSRQAAFAKIFGYRMGFGPVTPEQQLKDQEKFTQIELETTHRRAAAAMAKAKSLMGKSLAVMREYEIVNDGSFVNRLAFAQQALAMVNAANAPRPSSVHHTVTHDTRIGEINLNSPSNDPKAHVDVFRQGISNHPLLSPAAQGSVALGTRAME